MGCLLTWDEGCREPGRMWPEVEGKEERKGQQKGGGLRLSP